VVLRGAIDPAPITAEVDRVLLDVFLGDTTAAAVQRSETSTFQYVPMMCERTPVSLGLLDQCSEMAAELFGRAVLPGRAKGTRYFGDTAWHRDNPDDDAPPSVVFVAYLDSVDASNGALRVLVGSHVDRDPSRPGARPGDATSATVDTEPGDIIAFDEHLLHGSTGGVERRQWRVDFVIDPRGADEVARVRAQYLNAVAAAQLEDANTRYPSYGPYWQARERPWTNRLRELDVY
jgi:hypothetical protein